MKLRSTRYVAFGYDRNAYVNANQVLCERSIHEGGVVGNLSAPNGEERKVVRVGGRRQSV